MKRRRFSEKDVIRTLLHQGIEINDYRTGEPITLDNVDQIEREHLHEIALGGPDDPANCRYSLGESHAVVTNGNRATSAGSSKNRCAKANNPGRTEKFLVVKLGPQPPIPPAMKLPDLIAAEKCRGCGEFKGDCTCPKRQQPTGFQRRFG